mgnify:CR=1 FL=1
MRRDIRGQLDLDLLSSLDAGRAVDSEHLAVDRDVEGLARPDAGRHDDAQPALQRLLRLHLRLQLRLLRLLHLPDLRELLRRRLWAGSPARSTSMSRARRHRGCLVR